MDINVLPQTPSREHSYLCFDKTQSYFRVPLREGTFILFPVNVFLSSRVNLFTESPSGKQRSAESVKMRL